MQGKNPGGLCCGSMPFACLSMFTLCTPHLCVFMYFYLRCEHILQIMRAWCLKLIYVCWTLHGKFRSQSHNSLSFHQQLPRHWTPSSNTCSSSNSCSSTINSNSSNTITNRPTPTPRTSCLPSITWPHPASSRPLSRLQDLHAPPPPDRHSSPHHIGPTSRQPAASLRLSPRPCLYRWVCTIQHFLFFLLIPKLTNLASYWYDSLFLCFSHLYLSLNATDGIIFSLWKVVI